MQIQNDYNSYSGRDYRNRHSHPVTEGLYDQGEKPEKEEGAGPEKASPPAGGHLEETRQKRPDPGRERDPQTGKGAGSPWKISGMLRQAWEAMGDENETQKDSPGPVRDVQGGIYGVCAALKQFFNHYVTQPFESARDRVKAGAGAAFQRFGERRDAFGALSDPKSSFTRKRQKQGTQEKMAGGGRRRRPEILTAIESDSHLMDSYSRAGTYCRLNENLSGRQERREENRRAFSEREALAEPDAPGSAKNSRGSSRDREERLDKRL